MLIQQTNANFNFNYFLEKTFSEGITEIVLSFLPPREILKCCQVSSYFNTSANQATLWEKVIAKNFGDYAVKLFSPLVKERFIAPKEVFRYQTLAFVVCSGRVNTSAAFILRKNPQMRTWERSPENDDQVKACMPQPKVIKNGQTFFISKCTDITLRVAGAKDTVLPIEDKRVITNLCHDESRLFALRKDGCITVLDHLSQTNYILETAFAKKTPKILQYEQQISKGHGSICKWMKAHEDYLLIYYANTTVFESIDLNTGASVVYEDAYDFKEPLIFKKTCYQIAAEQIWVWDLEKEVRKLNISLHSAKVADTFYNPVDNTASICVISVVPFHKVLAPFLFTLLPKEEVKYVTSDFIYPDAAIKKWWALIENTFILYNSKEAALYNLWSIKKREVEKIPLNLSSLSNLQETLKLLITGCQNVEAQVRAKQKSKKSVKKFIQSKIPFL